MASSSKTDDDLATIHSEQRREFALAKALETDLDYAFDVQMQEAITASLALKPSPSDSDDVFPPESVVGSEENVDVLAMAEAFIQSDIESYAREREDRELCEAVMRTAKEDLNRRIHDQRVAGEVAALPEDYWSDYGNWFEKPYGSSSSSASPVNSGVGEYLRLYFKGVVSEERIREANVVVAGAGIAICDPKNNLLFHSRKNLEAFYGGQVASGEMAELEALCEGLDKAIAFGFKCLVFICFDRTLYSYLINRSRPRNVQTASLINKVNLLRSKFSNCIPHLAAESESNPAFRSAREAVVSQIRWSDRTIEGERGPRETCVICFEDTDVAKMFSIEKCLHRYCFQCMKRHVEAKLHGGQAAKCPHEGCDSEVAVECCAGFLPPNLVEVMGQRTKESAIPAWQRIYCPDPKCSALMSKNEALAYTKRYFLGAEKSSARKCVKCQKFFCMDCKVPWHYEMSCEVNRIRNPNAHGNEQMLKSLAKKKLWRQCAKCSHMVELADGCYHITCRCGYEFCYTCGAEWKNKSPTCLCPIWNERNIIRQPQLQRR